MGEPLRPEVYPLLPDSDGADSYFPHPDGRPWRKACAECAFRISDPQDMGEHWQRDLRTPPAGSVFYCLHRQDEGHERICACFAAVQAGSKPETPVPADREGGR